MIEIETANAPNPLEDIPFVGYFSMSNYLDGQVPIQMRPPRFKKGIGWFEIVKTFMICDFFATLGFIAGFYVGGFT